MMNSIDSVLKRTMLASAVSMTLATGAQAAFTPLPDKTSYTMTITGGCFDFGNCQDSGNGVLTDNTTANQATFSGFGSGIIGDGVMGVIEFTLVGGNISVTSYSQDSYLATAGGTFYLQDQDGGDGNSNGALMSGTLDGSGNMTFVPTGRDGLAAKFAGSLGLQEWNRDNSSDNLGSNKALADPVSRKRPGARCSSTACLMETNNSGSLCTSSKAIRFGGRLRINPTGSARAISNCA